MAGKQKGLGKGLGALLGETAVYAEQQAEGTVMLPLQKIEPNPMQPRSVFDETALQELADSIRVHGIIQPLTVRKLESGYYQIIAGERRWRAARIAELSEVPVVIIEADDRKAAELALIENLQREDLNPMEEARGYQRLMKEFGMTQEATAERVGKSRPAVTNAVRLLKLPDQLQDCVESGKLSPGHARAILSVKTETQQLAAAQRVMSLALSVRQTETLCKKLSGKQKPAAEAENACEVDYLRECEKELKKRLGRGVRIVPGKKKGRVELEYYDDGDLQNLYEQLHSLPGKKDRK